MADSDTTDAEGRNQSRPQLMTYCLRVQSAFLSPQRNFSPLDTLSQCESSYIDLLFDAITYYLHPNQSQALAKLAQQVPHDPSLPSPIYKQYNVPTEILPSLFPNIDTTRIAPQYDWFMYLLSRFNPISDESYYNLLAEYVEQHSQALLAGTFSFPDAFIHNCSFNSYDEYLEVRLPQLGYHPTNANRPSIFSYFPNQHPMLPIMSSKEAYARSTSTEEYKTYFVWAFLLGTSLLVQHSPDYYTTLNYERFMDSFGTSLPNHPCLVNQVTCYKYRTYLLTMDSQTLHHHLNSLAQRNPTNSIPPLRTTPPIFSHFSFPLQLALLGKTSFQHYCNRELFSPTFIKYSSVILILISDRCSSILMHHVFVKSPSYILVILESLSYAFNNFEDRSVFEIDGIHWCTAFIELFVLQSYGLYLQGKDTLHQQLYFKLMLVERSLSCDDTLFILHLPFLLSPPHDNIIQKHITLCLHAGFLNPFPHPLSTAFNSLSKLSRWNPSPTQLSQTISLIHHALIPFRAFFHCYLLNLINFEVYFPNQSNKLLDFIPTLLLSFIPIDVPLRIRQCHKIPKHFHKHQLISPGYLRNPIKSNPRVKSSLVDSGGRIHALVFQPDDQTTVDDNPDKFDHIDENPFLIDEFCVHGNNDLWNPYIERCPYSRPLLSVQDETRIGSPHNEITLKSTPAVTILQNEYTQYRRDLGIIETNLVIDQMKKVLDIVDFVGLVDEKPSTLFAPIYSLYNSFLDICASYSFFPSSPSVKSYPFPPPIPTPDTITTHYAQQLSNWALEMLIVTCFNIQPFQPLKQSALPNSPGSDRTTTNIDPSPPLSQEFINNQLLNSPEQRTQRITNARNRILSAFSILPQIRQYMSPEQLEKSKQSNLNNPNLTTKHDYLFDCLLHSILSPTLKLIQSLNSLPKGEIILLFEGQ